MELALNPGHARWKLIVTCLSKLDRQALYSEFIFPTDIFRQAFYFFKRTTHTDCGRVVYRQHYSEVYLQTLRGSTMSSAIITGGAIRLGRSMAVHLAKQEW